jgi:hypothetical protein
VRPDEVCPGDIVVYRDDLGRIEHTGVVVWVDRAGPLSMPWVVSKWANHGEYLHRVNNCPYRGMPVYMREGQNDG